MKENLVAQMVSSREVEVYVSYHLFGLVDAGADEDLPVTGNPCGWAGVGRSAIVFEAEEDLTKACLRLELWDGAAQVDSSRWPDTKRVELTLPTGSLSLDQLTAGVEPDVFVVPSGTYDVRLGWRPEGVALVQMWSR